VLGMLKKFGDRKREEEWVMVLVNDDNGNRSWKKRKENSREKNMGGVGFGGFSLYFHFIFYFLLFFLLQKLSTINIYIYNKKWCVSRYYNGKRLQIRRKHSMIR
jgi:hypothetical protein